MPGFGYGFGLGRASGGDLASFLASRGLTGSVAGADFRARRYWLPATSTFAAPRPAAEAEFFAQFTAATTTRTFIDASGNRVSIGAANVPRFDYSSGTRRLLLEDASTNLIIGSAAPATQNVTTTATTYTLALEGTGSITLSGTGTGILTGTGAGWQNRVKLTFTATAGTLTLTVTGSVENVQLEAKLFASSYIPTTGAAVTRAIETFRLPAAVETVMGGASCSPVVRATLAPWGTGGVLFSAGSGVDTNRYQMFLSAAGHASLYGVVSGVGTVTISTSGAAIAAYEAFGAAAAVAPANYAVDDSNGAIATSTAAGSLPTVTQCYLGRRQDGGANFGAGSYDLFAVWPVRLPNASIQSLAVPYA